MDSHTQQQFKIPKKQNQALDLWRAFSANKAALVGLVIVLILVLVACLADVIVPYEQALEMDARNMRSPPGAGHPFGTDNMGRDMFARIVHGSRVSLTMGFVPTIVSLFIGMVVGSLAGYMGGWVENLIMRICDIFACIPAILLALTFSAVLGQGIDKLLIAITIASIPVSIRYVRSVILGIVELEYIEAGRACGTGTMGTIFKHILPNAMGPLILNAATNISGMIMTAAGLSYLGMGIQPPDPEWGYMLSENQQYMRSAPHLMLVPGIAILISVLSFNLVGDGLRDALDPKLRR